MSAEVRRAHARAFLAQPPTHGRAWSTKSYAYDFEEDGMLYLHWFDDTAKKTTAQKLTEACAAYAQRFGTAPNVVLVNELDQAATCPGCEVRAERRIGPNNYQVGRQE